MGCTAHPSASPLRHAFNVTTNYNNPATGCDLFAAPTFLKKEIGFLRRFR